MATARVPVPDFTNSSTNAAEPSVRVLGPIQFVDASGLVHDLPSASQRRLLAVLALNLHRTVRGEYLADLLDVTPGALRTTVSRLRRIVGADALFSDPLGYRLEASTDADEFVGLVPDRADGSDRLGRLDAAIDLWRGKALEEFTHESWAHPEVARLAELHVVVLEARADELIARGRHGEAVAELERLIPDHPLRDRPRGLLMQALAGQGRDAEALRVFQQYRAYLSDTVGMIPSAAVRRIEQQIAERAGDLPSSEPAPTLATPDRIEPDTLSRSLGLLPTYRSSLVGRETDVASVADEVRARRIVTLTGQVGVGKTRVAVQAAIAVRSQMQAVWFVDLAQVTESGGAFDALADAIGASSTTDAAGVCDFVGARRALLVIDNCEHVLGSIAELVEALTSTCPNITVLATSLEPLGLDGEQVVLVRPLELHGSAVRLFVERAGEAGADVHASDTGLIDTICSRLDGNPLAIELAAARAGALGLETIRDGLDDRFGILVDRRRGGGRRHQSLRAAVDWSYRLLPADEQRLFRTLAVFSGGFELDAARHVMTELGEAPNLVLSRLGRLVDRSMVVSEPTRFGTRFHLLETLRAFATDELETADELEVVQRAHADWVACLTDIAMTDWMSADAHRRTLRLERDLDNWRDAIQFACRSRDAVLAQRLAGPPSVLITWGRPHLGTVTDTLEALIPLDPPGRLAVALAAWGGPWSRVDTTAMRAVEDRLRDIDPSDRIGALALVASAREAVEGELAAAIERRTRAVDNPLTPPDVADFQQSISLYLTGSRAAGQLCGDDWVARALSIADRTDVPVNRVVACIALAWTFGNDGDIARSETWAQAALAHNDEMPLYFATLAGTFVSRFLIGQAPSRAATMLRSLLDQETGAGTIDSIALATSAGLMARAEHPDADDVVASLVSIAPRFIANLVPDLVDRQARGTQLGHEALIGRVHAALTEIAAASP